MRYPQLHRVYRSIAQTKKNSAPLVGVKNTAAILNVQSKLRQIVCVSGTISRTQVIWCLVLLFTISIVSFYGWTHAFPNAHAAIARELPFSARLKSFTTGNIVDDGNYSITFRIYTVETGGSAVWSETQTVAVKDGIVSTSLGTSTPIPTSLTFNESAYYLGITIGSDAEMTPRKKIGSVPSALNAGTVNGYQASTTPTTNQIPVTDGSGGITLQGGVTVGSSILPSANGINIGSSTNKFGTIYVDTLSAGSFDINGTSSDAFTLNTDQATNNTESSSMRFYLGPTLNTSAALQWTGASNQFDLYSRLSSSTYADLKVGGLTASSITSTGTLSVTGDFAINTNKLTVSASSGNTVIAGTLNVTGNTGLSTLSTSGLASLNSVSTTGSANVGTTLGVTGLTTLGQLTVNGNGTGGDTDITLGDATTDQLVVTAAVASDIIPLTDNTYSLGSASKRWANFYAANAVFDTISTQNTTANDFYINSDNASADTEDATLQFERGSTSPNAIIGWNSTSDYLYANLNWVMEGNTTFGNASSDTVTSVAATWTFSNASTVALATATDALNFSSNLLDLDTTNGRVGIGTATPAYKLEITAGAANALKISQTASSYLSPIVDIFNSTNNIEGIITANGTAFALGTYSSSDLQFLVGTNPKLTIDTNGDVGIGSTSPVSKLHVATAPDATANYGTVSIGNGPFDGSTSGFFAGSSSGTQLAINGASGYGGNLADLQVAGSSKFRVTAGGVVTAASTINGATISGGTLSGGMYSNTAATGSGAYSVVAQGGNLSMQASTGLTLFNQSSVNNEIRVYGSGGSNYISVKNDNTNGILSTSSGELQLSGSGTNQFIVGDTGAAVNLVFEESSTISGQGANTITVGVSGDTINLNTTGATYNVGTLGATGATLNTTSTSTTALTINGPSSLTSNLLDLQVNGSSKLSVTASGILNATTDGLATKVVAGAVSDGSFTGTAVNGQLGVDSSNGRLYFRYGGAWHYVAQTAGFQIPNYETDGISVGQAVVGLIDSTVSDGGLHGVFRPIEEVTPFKDLKTAIQDIKTKIDNQGPSNAELQNQVQQLQASLANPTFGRTTITGGLKVASITSPADLTISAAVNKNIVLLAQGTGSVLLGSQNNNLSIDSSGKLIRNGTALTNSGVDQFGKVAASKMNTIGADLQCNGSESTITIGLHNPDVPRVLRVTSQGSAGGTLVITGTLADGTKDASDRIDLSDSQTSIGKKAFAKITQIALPAQCPIGTTLAIGTTDKLGLSNSIHGQQSVYKIKRNSSDIDPLPSIDAENSTIELSPILDNDDISVWYRY